MIELGDEEIIEIDCPKCEKNYEKHNAIVISKTIKGNKTIYEIQCMDCKSKGVLTTNKLSKIEILEFPPEKQ